MNQLIHDIAAHLSFWWPTLLAATALAVAGGIGGTLVVLRRQTLLALSLPQIVALGAAVGLRMGWATIPPAAICLAIALLMIAWAERRNATHLLLPALYVAGSCLSILVVAGAGAELIHVQNLFVGIDVAVSETESIVATIILLLCGCGLALLWRRWLLLAQSPAAARLAQLRPARWDALFLALISIILVASTDALGTAMGIVMLFLPAVTVLPWARRVPSAMFFAAMAGIMFLIVGDILSNRTDWPLSQSVGGTGFAAFLLSVAIAFTLKKFARIR